MTTRKISSGYGRSGVAAVRKSPPLARLRSGEPPKLSVPPLTIVCETPRSSSMPPSVTMNGCRLRRVISGPWIEADQQRDGHRDGDAEPERVARSRRRSAAESLAMMHAGQADDRADREVDAAGDDDEGDADGEDPEHRDLPGGVETLDWPRKSGLETRGPGTCDTSATNIPVRGGGRPSASG